MRTIATGFCICFALATVPAAGHAGQGQLMSQRQAMPQGPLTSQRLLTPPSPGITMHRPQMISAHPASLPAGTGRKMAMHRPQMGSAHPRGKHNHAFSYKKIKFEYDKNDESEMDVYVGK